MPASAQACASSRAAVARRGKRRPRPGRRGVRHARAVLDQRHRVMPAPGGRSVAEIAAQRLLAPGHLRSARRSARRRRRCGSGPGLRKRDGQRAVPAHRMAGDRPGASMSAGKFGRDQRGQLVGRYSSTSGKLAAQGASRRIDIEAGALAEIIGLGSSGTPSPRGLVSGATKIRPKFGAGRGDIRPSR